MYSHTFQIQIESQTHFLTALIIIDSRLSPLVNAMASKVKLDLRVFNKMKKRLIAAQAPRLQVGHVIPKMHPNALMSMAEIGKINHDGETLDEGKVIPSRPYLTNGIMKQMNMNRLQASMISILMGNSTGYNELRKLGPKIRKEIQMEIKAFINK